MKEEKRGRGRPKKEGAKTGLISVRLSPEDERMLDLLQEEIANSRPDAMRRALQLAYSVLVDGKYK